MSVQIIPFQQQLPFLGSHLQSMRIVFRRDHPDVSALNPAPIQVPMNDGSGDVMTGIIHTPAEQRFPGLLLVAGHGFGGSAQSAYTRWVTKFFYDLGFAICRLNLRGAGNSRPLCRNNYHGACGDDLIRLWAWLLTAKPPAVPFRVERTYFMGASLSGSILANALAKIDNTNICAPSDLKGVIGGLGICFPFDMAAAVRKIHSVTNWPYLKYFLSKIKPLFAAQPGLDQVTKSAIAAAKSIVEIDNLWTAPRLEFSSAFDFYAHASSRHWVPQTKRPFRIVATADDPLIECRNFLASDWRNPLLEPKLFSAGGHCGLWERGFRYQRHLREALLHVLKLVKAT